MIKVRGNFQSEFCSLSADALNIDFAVQRIQIRSHHVQPNAAPGQFGLDRSRSEARMEQHFTEVTLGQTIRCLR
jgi:hypothetical protein